MPVPISPIAMLQRNRLAQQMMQSQPIGQRPRVGVMAQSVQPPVNPSILQQQQAMARQAELQREAEDEAATRYQQPAWRV